MWPERKTQSDTENSVCAEHTKMEWMNCTTQLNIFATTMGLIFWTSAQPTVFSLRGHFVRWRALAAWFTKTVWKRLVLCNQLKAAANSLYIRPSMANAVQSIPIPEYGELPLLKHNFTMIRIAIDETLKIANHSIIDLPRCSILPRTNAGRGLKPGLFSRPVDAHFVTSHGWWVRPADSL